MTVSLVKKVFAYFSYAFFPISLGLFVIGYLLGNFNIILCGILSMFVGNLMYCFLDVKNRSILLILHITLFTFLLSRPTISMFRGNEWWYFDTGSVYFALNALMLTLISMRIGTSLCGCLIRSKNKTVTPIDFHLADNKSGFMYSLQTVALIFFFVTMAVYLLKQGEKLVYMSGRDYEEYYTSFKSQLPSIVHTLSAMMRYSLCVFLATMPSKSKAFIPLALYFISEIPTLIIGLRNPIVLNAIFVLMYYIIRDSLEDKQRWLGKIERWAIVLIVPVALFLLSAYNYLRQGQSADMNVWDSIVDLFYKQGVSFDVLCMGYNAIPELPDAVTKNYTFGGIIDYIKHGSIAQSFFGAIDLGSHNSELLAVYGSSFAHSMSYVAHPRYLEGEGWGSSYLLETFADWGYIGIIVFSLALGSITVWMLSGMRKGVLLKTVILVSLTNLFFIPRAEATGWLSFLFTIQFWLAVCFCYFCATVLTGPTSHLTTCSINHIKRGKYYA